MPIGISNAVNKLNHNNLRLCLSSLRLRLSVALRLRLSRFNGYAYRAVLFAIWGSLMVMLIATGIVLCGILLAVLIG